MTLSILKLHGEQLSQRDVPLYGSTVLIPKTMEVSRLVSASLLCWLLCLIFFFLQSYDPLLKEGESYEDWREAFTLRVVIKKS